MNENIRLFFSVLWIFATGAFLGSLLAFVFTWGGYTGYLYTAAIVWVISSVVTIVTSL